MDEGTIDCPDLDFEYDDTDKHPNEIAELYSYTEGPEFQANMKAFEELMEQFQVRPQWQGLDDATRKSVLLKLAEQLELSNKASRMKAARAILYIAQGCWGEVQSDAEQQSWTRKNILLLYKAGIFHTFLELLNFEIEGASNMAMRKLAVSLADSWDLRVILSVFYTIVEVFRSKQEDDSEEFKKIQEEFRVELSQPINDELLAVKLLGMVTRFCSGSCPHFPMKKVLLLLWKVLLVSLGGMKEQRELKAKYRREAGLPIPEEDTVEVTRTMRAASPPASAADLLEAQNQKPGPAARPFRRSLVKQSSLDESLTIELENNDQADDELREIEERRAMEASGEIPQPPSPRPTALPWAPKVRQKDVDQFLDATRMKFVGFILPNDRISLAGLPQPIHEGVRVLKQHMYLSLTEIQIQREEDINKNPISKGPEEIVMTPAEVLYQAMLPSLPQYMIALLKILLAAAPTSKAKTDSINIMADVLPEEMPIAILDFPSCVIGDQPELTAESLEIGSNQPYCWRNLFSCVNLLRILNKLTKWKHSRIMMLVVFKSAPILKRTLKVKHALLQLYVLKLLKMQTKYLGRQWRKSNMKTMSAIYQKVRHRLNDDWAFGNGESRFVPLK
nr:EOG090X01YQ [Macrothrix elegans]